MKKVVVKLNMHDKESKQKAMEAVSSLQGVTSIALNAEDSKITVIGEVDPVQVVKKLKKWYLQIDTVGHAEEEKKDDKKDGGKKDGEKEKEEIAALMQAYKIYNPYYTQYHPVYSIEENPNGCVIC